MQLIKKALMIMKKLSIKEMKKVTGKKCGERCECVLHFMDEEGCTFLASYRFCTDIYGRGAD
ncbi:MAG: hypothetical protein GY765_37330 [bacterium]|nr:hypothetical protein [bacterium]